MTPKQCFDWVREFGGTQMDFRTNLHVVEFVADKALEYCIEFGLGEKDAERCKEAKAAAERQISEFRATQ